MEKNKGELELAGETLGLAFPDEAFGHLEITTTGWDNLVAIADKRLVFRMPKRADYPRQQERWALQRLQGKVSLAIPNISHWSDDPPCMGYAMLGGIHSQKEWYDEPPEAWNGDLAGELARFLHQCHSAVGLDEAKAAGLKAFSLSPLSNEQLLEKSGDMELELWHYAEKLLRQPKGAGSDETQSFLYGDLHFGNLLFDSQSRKLRSVIDFGNVCWGGLSGEFYDLGGSNPKLCAAVLQAYERVSGSSVDRLKIRQQVAVFCLSMYADLKTEKFRPMASRRMANLMREEF